GDATTGPGRDAGSGEICEAVARVGAGARGDERADGAGIRMLDGVGAVELHHEVGWWPLGVERVRLADPVHVPHDRLAGGAVATRAQHQFDLVARACV